MPASNHAVLGASSAARWFACPGSVRLIQELPEGDRDKKNRYAQEGTAAHYLAELCLKERVPPYAYTGRWMSDFGVMSDTEDEPNLPGDWFEMDMEMCDAVQMFCTRVYAHLQRLGNAELRIEERVKPIAGRDDELYGTSDVIIYEPFGELIVMDFKYGKGKQVAAEHNDQAMYYGLGALRGILEEDEEVSKVKLCIVQPRGYHPDGPVREWDITPEALLDFADHLIAAADLTKQEDAPVVPGDHCKDCFCPVARSEKGCEVFERHSLAGLLDVVPDDLEDIDHAVALVESRGTVWLPDPNDGEQLARAAEFKALMDFWGVVVEERIQSALERGVEVRNRKLGRARSHRKWKDPADVERRLRQKSGVRVDDFMTRKLKSPAQIEKLDAVGEDWVEKHAFKPEGKVKVIHVDDPRPALPPIIQLIPELED